MWVRLKFDLIKLTIKTPVYCTDYKHLLLSFYKSPLTSSLEFFAVLSLEISHTLPLRQPTCPSQIKKKKKFKNDTKTHREP